MPKTAANTTRTTAADTTTTDTTAATTTDTAHPAAGGRQGTKYTHVADALREQITSGTLPPASPLPSESEIIAAFGVSRPTARAALRALRAEGLIVVLKGKGSFVRPSSDRPAHTQRRTVTRTPHGDYADTTETAGWTVVEEPATYRVNATPDLALAVGVLEHTPLFVYDRLLADRHGRRMSHRLYLPFESCHGVAELTENPFRAPAELYGILERAGHELGWTESVRARMATPDDRNTLHIPDATPQLITRRATHNTTTGRVLALEETRQSADDTQLTYQLTPTTPLPDPQ
jgi:GntR family transcriptional regulator